MSGYPGKVSRLAFATPDADSPPTVPEITVWEFAGKGPENREPRMLRAHDTVTALAWAGRHALMAATRDGTVRCLEPDL